MRVNVETHAGGTDIAKPKRFRLDGRCVEIVENIDRWFGPDYSYFKVRGDDGDLYILRLDEVSNAWELTMFQRQPSQSAVGVRTAGRPHDNGEG